MLKLLRKKGVMKKLLWVVAIIIILVFGFLSQASRLANQKSINYAGKVFGRKVSLGEFQRNYHHVYIRAMMQHGENFLKIKEYLNIDSQTWDRIILLNETKKRNIKIADQDVVKAIQNIPFFQKNGQFNNELYENILRNGFRINSREFEEGMRDTLKFAELFVQETNDLTVADEQILNTYKLQNEKVQISYIFFPASDYVSDVEYDEIQTKDYYLMHKEDFLMPPMVNVQYIRIDYPEDANDEDNEKLEDSVTDIEYALSTTTPDLHAIAKEYDLTVETSGFFSMEQPNLKIGWSYAILQQIFYMAEGDISDIIETPQGFQFIKMLEKRDAMVPEYSQVKDEVKKAWSNQVAKEIAEQKATKHLTTIQQQFAELKWADFADIVKNQKLEIHQTPVFRRGEYLPNIGIAPDFQDAAFSLTKESPLSDIIEVQRGYCILHLDSIVPIDMYEYEKEKKEFSKTLWEEKRNKLFASFLMRLRVEANLEDNIAKSAEK